MEPTRNLATKFNLSPLFLPYVTLCFNILLFHIVLRYEGIGFYLCAQLIYFISIMSFHSILAQ
jgi:hypothetical protein